MAFQVGESTAKHFPYYAAIQEAGVSRHHSGPIAESPQTPVTITRLYRIEGFKGGSLLGSHYAERLEGSFPVWMVMEIGIIYVYIYLYIYVYDTCIYIRL